MEELMDVYIVTHDGEIVAVFWDLTSAMKECAAYVKIEDELKIQRKRVRGNRL